MNISTVPSHPRNPETKDLAVEFHLSSANRQFYLAARRDGDRKEWAERSAAGMMGLAAFSAELAASLRGHEFSLLPGRDLSIDEVCR